MNKDDLLRQIAETAYNVGFGAKKHFATYDIVDKSPGRIGFLSMAVGIFSLVFDTLSSKSISAFFTVFGIAGLYIDFYKESKLAYEEKGIFLTKLFNDLKKLYFKTKSVQNSDFEAIQKELSEIEDKFYSNCISKHIVFSDWYTHYKFFWQHQIDWVDEQKNFRLFRDKIPLSLTLTVSLATIFLIWYFWPNNIIEYISNFCKKQ